MGFVIDGFIAIAFAVLVIWLASLFKSISKDQIAAREQAKQQERTREYAERQAELYRTREKLRCLGCDHSFSGPLPDSGCPNCRIAALVVTEREFQSGRQAARQANRQDKES